MRGGIVSLLLGLMNRDARVTSTWRGPRSFGNTNNLAGGVSLKPQSEERVSEQSLQESLPSEKDGGQNQQKAPGWT